MFAYYLDLALRSMKRNPVLTMLMVLAIALGIGASMTTLTVLHVLSGDPLPGRSAQLYYPQIDPWDKSNYGPNEEPPTQLAWTDGMALLKARHAQAQALMTGGVLTVQPTQSTLDPFQTDARYTTADFFPMFGVPFRYGHGWGAAEDDAEARVAVISHALNEKLFGGRDSTGEVLHLKDTAFRVIGVLGDWHPNPHFYDLNVSNYAEEEGVYLPLSTSQALYMPHDGSVDCWDNGGADRHHMQTTTCVWLQLWVQLKDASAVRDYRDFLLHYSQEQIALGRFQQPPNVRLRNVGEWLDYNRVVPGDVRLQVWLALGFLLVCLVNTVGLLLAKFLRRSGELSVRRALGASRRALFMQMLIEAGVVGVTGGLFGLLLALGGLWLVRQQSASYAPLARLDSAMLLGALTLMLASSLLAGLLPAWRACRVAPALQLKSN